MIDEWRKRHFTSCCKERLYSRANFTARVYMADSLTKIWNALFLTYYDVILYAR